MWFHNKVINQYKKEDVIHKSEMPKWAKLELLVDVHCRGILRFCICVCYCLSFTIVTKLIESPLVWNLPFAPVDKYLCSISIIKYFSHLFHIYGSWASLYYAVGIFHHNFIIFAFITTSRALKVNLYTYFEIFILFCFF